MDKQLFIHREIKHVLEVLKFIPKEDRIKFMAMVDTLGFDDLLEVLKVLYKIEQDYLNLLNQDIVETDQFLKSLHQSK
jgi:hypothetical protein